MKTHSLKLTLFLAAALVLVFQNCSPKKQTSAGINAPRQRGTYTYEGGDGTSFETAVIILEKSSGTGIDAEYAWIDLNFPGNSILSQSLVNHGGHAYDVIEFRDANKKSHSIYFQIDNFFGKW
ncbi:MAG: hypothetical protein ACKVOK_16030 [Flavobacteriales bacterium]